MQNYPIKIDLFISKLAIASLVLKTLNPIPELYLTLVEISSKFKLKNMLLHTYIYHYNSS